MSYCNLSSYDDFKAFFNDMKVFEDRPAANGTKTVVVKNWRVLDSHLFTIIEMSHAVFRGQAGPDRLEPSIFRREAFDAKSTIQEQNEYVRRCLKHFREAIRGRRGPVSKSLDDYRPYELWSLGRHFGLKNTLLDWSHSPYVALFFAFEDWSSD